MSKIEQFLIPDLFYYCPERFNIFVFVSNVGIVGIQPKTGPPCHLFPLGLVFPDALFRLFVELGYAVFFYVFLVLEPELFFHLYLNGQAVSIPAGFAQNKKTAHRLIAAVDVFIHAGQEMSDVGQAVGRRRTFPKNKLLRFLAIFQRLLKNFVLFPERQRVLLYSFEI